MTAPLGSSREAMARAVEVYDRLCNEGRNREDAMAAAFPVLLAAPVTGLPDDELLTSGDRLNWERQEFEALDAGCETGEVADALRRSRTATLANRRADLVQSLLHALARAAPTGELR